MNTDPIQKFFDAVTADPELHAQIRAAIACARGGDPSEALARLAKEHHLPGSVDEFRAHLARVSENELNLDQLDSIAGGNMGFRNPKSPFVD